MILERWNVQKVGPHRAMQLRKAASKSGLGGLGQLTVEALREAPQPRLPVLHLEDKHLMSFSSTSGCRRLLWCGDSQTS